MMGASASRGGVQQVRQAIAELLPARDHDDGSYGPLLIRLAWHCSGTYDKEKKNGGSNGGTMRFGAEQQDPENNGLAKARQILEPVKNMFPWISYADLYILAGCVAIEELGGPFMPFRLGRKDFTQEQAQEIYGEKLCPFGDGNFNPHGSRLPAADLGPCTGASSRSNPAEREALTIKAVRNTFQRLGLDDRETVVLIILGHQFGRCHPEVSGYEEAWYAFNPIEWNIYEHGLGYMSLYDNLHMLQQVETQAGKRQWEARIMGMRFMMLPSDVALGWCPKFREHVDFYNRNRAQFRIDAVAAWTKLTELGCSQVLAESQPQ